VCVNHMVRQGRLTKSMELLRRGEALTRGVGRVLSLVVLLALLVPQGLPRLAGAVPDDAARQLKGLQETLRQFEGNVRAGQEREAWLDLVRQARQIYLGHPRDEQGPVALFLMGQVHRGMYGRFRQTVDLDEAQGYFLDVARVFPRHALADDALYTAAEIASERGDHTRAAELLTRIVLHHAGGDRVDQSTTLLKKLAAEYKVPLPDQLQESPRAKNTQLATVLPVKYWSSDNYTRIVIRASQPVKFTSQLLEEVDDQPRRLYLDFQGSFIDPKYRTPIPIEDGLLKRVRTGQFNPGTVRVVLDIESIADYKIFNLKDPFRVVVDVQGKARQAVPGQVQEKAARQEKPPAGDATVADPGAPAVPFEVTAKGKPSAQQGPAVVELEDRKKRKPAVNDTAPKVATKSIRPKNDRNGFTLAQQLGLGVRRIVIDPGHGGKDPGATAFGLQEKDIVLKVAKKLAEILRQRHGYEVSLTREDDVYLELEERTAMANTRQADLFLSIHVNAHPSPKVKGIETFFLNLATNEEAMRVAARENATSSHNISDMQGILADLMKNSKIEESSRLAGFVQENMVQGLRHARYIPKSLGVKQAPFYVLLVRCELLV